MNTKNKLLMMAALIAAPFFTNAGEPKEEITEEELASLHFVEWCYRNNIPDREYTTEDYNLYLDVFLETDESIELWDSLANQYEVITLK